MSHIGEKGTLLFHEHCLLSGSPVLSHQTHPSPRHGNLLLRDAHVPGPPFTSVVRGTRSSRAWSTTARPQEPWALRLTFCSHSRASAKFGCLPFIASRRSTSSHQVDIDTQFFGQVPARGRHTLRPLETVACLIPSLLVSSTCDETPCSNHTGVFFFHCFRFALNRLSFCPWGSRSVTDRDTTSPSLYSHVSKRG